MALDIIVFLEGSTIAIIEMGHQFYLEDSNFLCMEIYYKGLYSLIRKNRFQPPYSLFIGDNLIIKLQNGLW